MQDANSTVFVAQHSAFAATRATNPPRFRDTGPGSHGSNAQPDSLAAAGASAQHDEDDEATVIVRRAASAPVMRPMAQAGPAGASAAQKLGLTALPGPAHADEHGAAAAQVRASQSLQHVEQ